MFWRVSGLQACPVDTILDKDEYTLEELLDEEELVQETKSLNPRLIEYLKQKETVRSLVRYLVVDMDDGEEAGGADIALELNESRSAGGGGGGNAGNGASGRNDRGEGKSPQSVEGEVGDKGQEKREKEMNGDNIESGEGQGQGRDGSGDQYQMQGESQDEAFEAFRTSSNRSSLDSQTSVDRTRRCFKYPFTACEIFCCEVEGIYNTLLESEDILRLFFSILDKRTRPLNTILAGYFSRVMGALLARRSSDIVLYMQSNPGILNKLVYHVDTTSVAEVLARLAGADDPVGYNESPSVTWLAKTDVLQLLVKSLRNDIPAEGQANAAEVLAAIARSTATQLTKSMANATFMQELVGAALSEHSGTAASHALNVCLALLEPLTVDPTMGRFPVTDIHDVLRQQAVLCLCQEDTLARLVQMLEVGGGLTGNDDSADKPDKIIEASVKGDMFSIRCLPTTYGQVKPPVGQLRLKIVDLLASLFRTTEPMAEQAVMRTSAIPKAMKMFLEYPFNNALHGGVTMLLTAFEDGGEDLRRYLLEEANLVEWLVGAPRTLNNASAAEKTLIRLRKDKTELRAGYCGHLTQIANRLQRCMETCNYTKSYLDGSDVWKEYKTQELDDRNRLESVLSWKCGRPASQVVGLHGMCSSGLAYGNVGHGDDDLGDEFDSDLNRFSTLEAGGPGLGAGHSDDRDGDSGEDEEGNGRDGRVTTSEENAARLGAVIIADTASENRGNASLSSASSGQLSMEDMDDDEVCFDMEADDETSRQKEADATDGLLELGDNLSRLAVADSENLEAPGDDVWN